MPEALKVLMVSSEVSPYAKSGGLGDVAGSLPKELIKLGVDCRVVFPKYMEIKEEFLKNIEYIDSFVVGLGWRKQSASIYKLDDFVPTYVVENDYYFNRWGFYGYGDDYERFSFFSKAAIEMLAKIDFKPDVIHLNDWQTAPAAVFLKDIYRNFYFYQGIKSLYTIHNLQYQGVFGREILNNIGLSDNYFTPDKMEFYGNINFMKSAILYADAVSTVSETYAEEIKNTEFGYGLNGALKAHDGNVYGIINGIDTEVSNPATDKHIARNFSAGDFSLRYENKRALQEELGLPVSDAPIIAIISRLADQKGLDLVSLCLDELMSMDVQLVILGTGEGRYESLFKNYAWRYPHKMSANIFFDPKLAQRIYASSDMFLMPSLFEPCGLGQLFSMRYGSIPIVRKTGGLNDTVTHYDRENKTGNGFVFKDYLASGMMWAINQAISLYGDRDEWNNIMKNAMNCDFSWESSAKKYIELYKKL
ncbi:MAG: glycogen synthase GlgA [Clostridiales bacterium]|nr:glycogen synthase GlgA [Clostridiales bacterium]